MLVSFWEDYNNFFTSEIASLIVPAYIITFGLMLSVAFTAAIMKSLTNFVKINCDFWRALKHFTSFKSIWIGKSYITWKQETSPIIGRAKPVAAIATLSIKSSRAIVYYLNLFKIQIKYQHCWDAGTRIHHSLYFFVNFWKQKRFFQDYRWYTDNCFGVFYLDNRTKIAKSEWKCLSNTKFASESVNFRSFFMFSSSVIANSQCNILLLFKKMLHSK